MDAWETLVSTSLIASGDAWEHLNNQSTFLAEGTYILLDGLDVEVDIMCFDVEIETVEYEIEVETTEFDVELETAEFEVEVC